MTRGSIRVIHTKECPCEGVKPQSRKCRCAPRVRIRLAGRDYTVGSLEKGWTLEDLGPFEEKLVDMRRALEEGRAPAPRKVVVLEQYAIGWFQNLHAAARAGSVSPLTFNTYEGDWRLHIKPFFGKYPLPAIDIALINRYIDEKLAAGYSKNKVMCSLTVLSGMLTDAAAPARPGEAPLIAANPMRSPRRGRHGTRRTGLAIEFERKAPKHLELDQARVLIELAPIEILDMVLCPLVTGFRRMEVAGLEWENLQWGQQYVELTGQLRISRGDITKPHCKYHSERVVPLVPCFAAALGRRRQASGFVYRSQQFDKPYSETEIKDILDELYIEAGMKPTHEERKRLREERAKKGWAGVSREHGLGWHALRHTYNSVLAQAGIPKHIREELLGHKKQDVTDLYTHVLSGDFARVRDVLEGAFGDIVRRRLELPAETTSERPGDPEVTLRAAEHMGTHESSSTPDFRDLRL